MRIALMADIHSNREAFEACLEHAAQQGVDRYVFLGDYVGYGADPVWVVETIMAMVEKGAVAIRGNHDHAVAELGESMNPNASLAMIWTRGQLGTDERQFLKSLPFEKADGTRRFVHALGQAPRAWNYVTDSEDALPYLMDTRYSSYTATFCGHVHVPRLFGLTVTSKTVALKPTSGVAVPLTRNCRWMAVLGSVGQPRDGDRASAYSILDVARSELTFHRVAYDVEKAANKIAKAGLPPQLAERLLIGR